MRNQVTIHQGDCLEILRTLPPESVHCCVTSPPYWGLRDYGCQGQIGLEATPQEYVVKMVECFAEVRRVLRADGTCWVNLGDSYATGAGGVGECPGGGKQGESWKMRGVMTPPNRMKLPGLKPKDLCGIPWRVAFALQAHGWYLRSDIIWHKPNPMPESVTDRPTKAHEYLFLLSKSERYHYEAAAIREPVTADKGNAKTFRGGGAYTQGRSFMNGDRVERDSHGNTPTGKQRKPAGWDTGEGSHGTIHRDGRAKEVEYTYTAGEDRNKRTVWTVATSPYSDAHFATFPPDLIKPCILAGCPTGGTVLDPFGGSGTTGQVALELGRSAILIELNPAYVALCRQRTNVTPGLSL